ncbi:Retrovirus-related Pol polyprotein from transposon RE1 [Vitis vinifera]|uniref:Retrovirus-related Pol polyprotein from transposon RE1 n=1 Tax=Vitis vinifera TaxID=29760 RepID=A0A438IBT1_VITVI|nr:Retrovirus-related Pol polyprotein from transposon RE1 [Vitis vinifera]
MPETTKPGFRKWKIENSMIMSWLINSMNNDIGENFLLFGTAKDIWDATKETYSSSENTSELFQVESALHDFRQGEQSVTQYYNTLTRELDDVRGRIMGIKPLPSLREVFSEVRREESRKKVMMGSKEQPAPTWDVSALAARSFNSSGGDRQKRDRPWCDYCKKIGHYKEACWKLHGKPADWKPKPRFDRDGRAHVATNSESTSVPEPSPFNKEQMEMLQKLLSQVGSGSTTGTTFTANRGGMKPWIVDTGASDHMTGDAAILQNYKPSNGHSSVHIDDGSNKLARDLQCVTKFYPNLCVFQDLKSGKMIGSAELCSELYLIPCGRFSNQVSQASCVQSQSLLESFNSVSNSKVLKSDNAKEYFTSSLSTYLQNHGIIHISSRVDTPQQNGVAERKNKHLLEVAWCLMFSSNVPNYFWGEAILTATYLINRESMNEHQVWESLLEAVPFSHSESPNPSQSAPTELSTPMPLPEENIGEDRAGKVSIPSIDDSTLPIALRKGVPNTIQEAFKISEWKKAVQDEIDALEKNGTWTITDLPIGKRSVGCKWIFTIKYKADGSVERFKARLVARGFTQSYGIDYQETFAPVAKLNTIRILLSLAINQDCMTKNQVCKLQKSLYGLKQSPRAWFDRFTKAVLKLGYKQGQADHTLFVKKSHAGKMAILIVYVDDIILSDNDMEELQKLKKYLSEEFEVKDLGNLKYFLGMEVARSRKGIVVSQRKCILDLLKETGMLGCKPIDTSMDSQKKLGIEKESTPVDRERYQRLVGRLIYLSHTRPDIGFAMSAVSQFMHSPTEEHMEAVYRILRYLKMTLGKGLFFRKTENHDTEVYSDVDWAGNIIDRRSTSGYCSFVWGNLVTWRSKKQSVVARSSAEAEYRALAQGICEGIWIKRVLSELGQTSSSPILMMCDNQATISIAKNLVHHDRTKHVEIDRHFIIEKVTSETVKLNYVPTKHQTIDILTKALPRPNFKDLTFKLGLYDIYSPA